MIKNSIVFLIVLSAFVFPKTETSYDITGIWVLKSVNGKLNADETRNYMELRNDGLFIWGDFIDGILEESRWVLDRDQNAVFLYKETKRNVKSNPPEIIKIEEFTKGTLILRFDNADVMAFENLNSTTSEVQELFKLHKVDSEGISEATKEGNETMYTNEAVEIVEAVEAVGQGNNKTSRAEEHTTHKKEASFAPEDGAIEDASPRINKTKPKRGLRMDILLEDVALIGRWTIVGINMGYGVMGKMETGKVEGSFDFMTDGAFKMNVNGTTTGEGLKWVLDQNNNTVIFYDLGSASDAKGKAEFHKIVERYKNKMTLQVEPIKWYYYLEKDIKE